MDRFDWNDQKNEQLRRERGVSFEEIVYHIDHGDLLGTIEHPNQEAYPGQKIFLVKVENYVVYVLFVENEELIFMKTIIPSRKLTKKYLRGKAQ